MTREEVTLREQHVKQPCVDHAPCEDRFCNGCGDDWPCPVVRLLDALAERESELTIRRGHSTETGGDAKCSCGSSSGPHDLMCAYVLKADLDALWKRDGLKIGALGAEIARLRAVVDAILPNALILDTTDALTVLMPNTSGSPERSPRPNHQ